MFLRWIKRATGAFSFRLNVYYAAFFSLLALVFFGFAYGELLSLLRKKDRDLVKSQLEQLVARYERGRGDRLRADFAAPEELKKNLLFMRLMAADGTAELEVLPAEDHGRDDLDLKRFQLTLVLLATHLGLEPRTGVLAFAHTQGYCLRKRQALIENNATANDARITRFGHSELMGASFSVTPRTIVTR